LWVRPLLGVGIAQEHAGLLVLDGVQGVSWDDLLGEELGLAENNLRQGRVVGVVDGRAHVARLDEGTVHLKQPLVVAQVVRVHLEVVADVGEALGAGHLAHRLAVHRDGDRARGLEHVGRAH
jgi:hypothetical protein